MDDSGLLPALDSADAAAEASVVDVREMSLLEFLGAFRRAPREGWRVWWDVLQDGRPSAVNVPAVSISLPVKLAIPKPSRPSMESVWARLQLILRMSNQSQLLVRIAAFLFALAGAMILSGSPTMQRSEQVELVSGTPYLVAGFGLWLLADLLMLRRALLEWWRTRQALDQLFVVVRLVLTAVLCFAGLAIWDATRYQPADALALVLPALGIIVCVILLWLVVDLIHWLIRRMRAATSVTESADGENVPELTVSVQEDAPARPFYMRLEPVRLAFALAGVIGSIVTWFGTSGNTFSTPIFYIWLLSVGCWSLAFAPAHWNPLEWIRQRTGQLRTMRWWDQRAALLALVVVLALGVWFRLDRLTEHPREMTDDHVEKILDAASVRDGARLIFFANNGGREPFQMYAIALASYLPGLEINHYTIKLVAVIESILTLPVLFWLGYELLEGESRRRRLLMGILLTSLIAFSYWHVAVTRLGLRIVLTPLISALLLIYLARAVRRNQVADFIKAGLVLGFGLYMYQAVRMLPVVTLVAVALAIYLTAQSWRERMRYLRNLMVLVWISLMVFIPMLHYSIEYPDLFWRRTAGRLLGDDVIEETKADGTIVMREVTFEDRMNALRDNLPVLASNLRNVLLTFTWKGDVATINGVPNRPTMDSYSGALLIIGCAAWLVWSLRKRDAVYWLVPLFVVIMLLPSALSIAFPIENPSHTRTSGAIPGVYLLAAFPLMLLIDYAWQQTTTRRGQIVAAGMGSLILLGSFGSNRHTYLDLYPAIYETAFHPYSVPGDYLRGFVLTGGSYGNAFMIGYTHWWSHRAIGLASGLEEFWPNGIVARTDIPTFLRDAEQRTDRFRFDPSRDIVFFFSPNDTETATYLAQTFADGYVREEATYKQGESFMVFRVPAMGSEVFSEWVAAQQ
jgi:hypothetical protein